MALALRQVEAIPHVEVHNDKPYKFNPNLSIKREQLLEVSSHNTYVGILSQLAILASAAGEIFGGLVRDADSTFQRITTLSGRVKDVSNAVSNLEGYLSSTPLENVLGNPRNQEFAIPIVQEAAIFQKESLPQALNVTYKKALAPPSLHKMDPYMDDGKKCLEMYTNPNFFLEQWIEEQKKQRAQAREERKKRREERRARKDKETTKPTNAPRQITKLDRVVYDPVTGEKMVVKGGKSEVTGVSQSSMANRSTNPMMSSQMSTASIAPTPSTSAFFDSPPPAPPTAPASFDLPPPPPPSSEEFNSFSPPPPPDDYPSFETPPSPPPRSYSKESTGSSNEVYGSPATPMREHTPANPPPPPPSYERPVNPSLPPPPPPPPSAEFNEIDSKPGGGLAAQLANRQQGLRKTEAQKPNKPADARSSLMENIKGGIQLRHTEVAVKKKPEPTTNSVAAILARRIAIVGSSDEDEEEDDDDGGWDD